MLTTLLKAKIHRATVTITDVNYHGSITIDSNLLKASGLLPNEAVVVADCQNGNRFETYVIP
jgi:aspartate 1-decarboxylase